MPNNSIVKIAGLVISRQSPGTASGVIFVTLEDETGFANVIVWPNVFKTHKQALLQSHLLLVTGVVQKESNVLHVIAKQLKDYSGYLPRLNVKSRNFH